MMLATFHIINGEVNTEMFKKHRNSHFESFSQKQLFTMIQQLAKDTTDYIILTNDEVQISSCTRCGICQEITETGCSGMDHLVCFQCRGAVCRPCGERLMSEAMELTTFAKIMRFHNLQSCPFCRASWIFSRYQRSLRVQAPPHERNGDVAEEISWRKRARQYGLVPDGILEEVEAAYAQAYEEAYEVFVENLTEEEFEEFQESGVFRWLSFEEFLASQ